MIDRLPTRNDYDSAIRIVGDMVDETDIHHVIKTHRLTTRHSDGYNSFLTTAAANLLFLEPRDDEGALVDSEHRLANVALSGLIVGSMVNRLLYPNRVSHFKHIIQDSSIDDKASLEIFKRRVEAAGGINTNEGQMLAVLAASKDGQSRLGQESLVTAAVWSAQMHDFALRFDDVPDESRERLGIAFGAGFGFDLSKMFWYQKRRIESLETPKSIEVET